MAGENQKSNLASFVNFHASLSGLADRYQEIYKNLEAERTKALNRLIWQTYRREIGLEDFLAKARALNLPDFETKIWPGVLRWDFLAMADYLGIKIQDWLKYLPPEEMKKLSFVFLADWVKKQDLALTEAEEKRLVALLGQYLSGAKEKDETAGLLARPEKIGGLELSADFAKNILSNFEKGLEEAMEKGEIITGQRVEIAIQYASFPQKRESYSVSDKDSRFRGNDVKKSGNDVKKSGNYESGDRNDERPPRPVLMKNETASLPLIRGIARNDRQPFIPSIQLYDRTAEDLIKKSGVAAAPELIQRFKIIIISRLKDVRKVPETRERLLAAPSAGGVGLKPEEAEKIIKAAEEERGKISNAETQSPNAKIAAETENKKTELLPVSPPMTVVPPPAAEKPKFTEPARPSPTPRPFSPPKPAGPATAVVSPPKPKPPSAPPKLQAPQVSSSDIKPAPPSAVKIIAQGKTRPKVELAPLPPLPAKPAPTVAIPQTQSGRAKVQDVAHQPRLVGPLEELGGMNLLEFRRLSPKPQVTADKIYAKIELLAEEGYEKKVKGVKAWRSSPFCRLYLSILDESVGRPAPVGLIIDEKRKAGKETLTLEEFKAVMELNGKLRF